MTIEKIIAWALLHDVWIFYVPLVICSNAYGCIHHIHAAILIFFFYDLGYKLGCDNNSVT